MRAIAPPALPPPLAWPLAPLPSVSTSCGHQLLSRSLSFPSAPQAPGKRATQPWRMNASQTRLPAGASPASRRLIVGEEGSLPSPARGAVNWDQSWKGGPAGWPWRGPKVPCPPLTQSPSHPHTATTLSSTVCQRACHHLRNWCQAVCFVFHCVCMGLVHCPSNVCAAHVSLTGVNLREGSLVLCSLDPSLYPLMVFVHLLKSLSASAGLGCIPEVLSNFSRHLSHKTRL